MIHRQSIAVLVTVSLTLAGTAPLLAALADEPALRYLHRAASLEDVFIKLTGRELRD